MVDQLRENVPEGLEQAVVGPRELRRIAFRGQARRYNVKDLFGLVYQAVTETRRRVSKWSDFYFSPVLCREAEHSIMQEAPFARPDMGRK